MQNTERSYTFHMPRTTYIGVNALDHLVDELVKLDSRNVLVVTDSFMAKSPILANISEITAKLNIKVSVYDGVEPNPTLSQVVAGMKKFVENECQALISLGGGSPHDCAKAIKLTITKSVQFGKQQIPLIAINTTAGTASELTRFAVITDSETHTKIPMVDTDIIPDIAIDDPVLMLAMPKGLTAATGMDALTHALEAYVSTNRNPITECTALKSIELIYNYLYRAYQDGNDLEARNGMVYAQYLAGMAFSNAGLGLVHAMAHQLGGLYNLPHGVCNALLLPYVMMFNHKSVSSSYGYVAKMLGICPGSQPDELASKALVRYVSKLCGNLNIPGSLKELKVNYEDCGTLAEMAMKDITLLTNPIQPKVENIRTIYEAAYHGNLSI